MSEQIQDQISAFTDDELSAEECAFLVRRLERDSKSRDKVLRYSIIGAALRGDLPNPDPDVLRRKLWAELDGVRPAQSAGNLSPARSGLFRPAVGLGIAASVAVAALALLNVVNRPGDVSDPVAQVAGTAADVGLAEQPSYVVPREVAGPLAVGDVRLTNYLISHGQYASGLGRTSIHTNVISNEASAVLVTPLPAQEP